MKATGILHLPGMETVPEQNPKISGAKVERSRSHEYETSPTQTK